MVASMTVSLVRLGTPLHTTSTQTINSGLSILVRTIALNCLRLVGIKLSAM
jgi:hypothetical protein